MAGRHALPRAPVTQRNSDKRHHVDADLRSSPGWTGLLDALGRQSRFLSKQHPAAAQPYHSDLARPPRGMSEHCPRRVGRIFSAVLVPSATGNFLTNIFLYSDNASIEGKINSSQLGLVWLSPVLPPSEESIPPLTVHPRKV